MQRDAPSFSSCLSITPNCDCIDSNCRERLVSFGLERRNPQTNCKRI